MSLYWYRCYLFEVLFVFTSIFFLCEGRIDRNTDLKKIINNPRRATSLLNFICPDELVKSNRRYKGYNFHYVRKNYELARADNQEQFVTPTLENYIVRKLKILDQMKKTNSSVSAKSDIGVYSQQVTFTTVHKPYTNIKCCFLIDSHARNKVLVHYCKRSSDYRHTTDQQNELNYSSNNYLNDTDHYTKSEIKSPDEPTVICNFNCDCDCNCDALTKTHQNDEDVQALPQKVLSSAKNGYTYPGTTLATMPATQDEGKSQSKYTVACNFNCNCNCNCNTRTDPTTTIKTESTFPIWQINFTPSPSTTMESKEPTLTKSTSRATNPTGKTSPNLPSVTPTRDTTVQPFKPIETISPNTSKTSLLTESVVDALTTSMETTLNKTTYDSISPSPTTSTHSTYTHAQPTRNFKADMVKHEKPKKYRTTTETLTHIPSNASTTQSKPIETTRYTSKPTNTTPSMSTTPPKTTKYISASTTTKLTSNKTTPYTSPSIMITTQTDPKETTMYTSTSQYFPTKTSIVTSTSSVTKTTNFDNTSAILTTTKASSHTSSPSTTTTPTTTPTESSPSTTKTPKWMFSTFEQAVTHTPVSLYPFIDDYDNPIKSNPESYYYNHRYN